MAGCVLLQQDVVTDVKSAWSSRVNPLDGPRPALNTRSMISTEIGLHS